MISVPERGRKRRGRETRRESTAEKSTEGENEKKKRQEKRERRGTESWERRTQTVHTCMGYEHCVYKQRNWTI